METAIKKNDATDDCLSAFARNPLRPLIERIAARITEEYQPEQIILYGSQATGKARPDSDIDLLVVKKTVESFITRSASVKKLVRNLLGKIPVSPIVLTPAEAQNRLDRGDKFIQQIFERGIKLLGNFNMAPKREDSVYPLDWLRVAERDWQRVEKRLAEGDQEDAGFRLQQALEKYLKAFLLANNWDLEKTHAIVTLLEEAGKLKPALSPFTDLCQRVENYYFAERYPSTLDAGIPLEEVEHDFKEAQQLREMILATFSPKPVATSEEKNKSAPK